MYPHLIAGIKSCRTQCRRRYSGRASQPGRFREHCGFAGQVVFRTMLDTSRNISLACALSALAGYVDAIGFLHLGGLFVAFMSGNSTRMGVSLGEGPWSRAAA